MHVLCVAEKPSMAKSIAQILSNGTCSNRPGKDKFCRNFDFVYRLPRHIFGQNTHGGANMVSAEMTVTSVRGHMMEFEFPENFGWQSCNPIDLFTAPILCRISKNAKNIAKNLTDESRRSDMLMIWTDCDREGENIGHEIAQHCLKSRSNLIVKRARFSAIIAEQIHRACMAPVELDLNAAYAVEARQEIDLRAGAAFTRLQTKELRSRFGLKDMLISYGPCQFPTLGFVVDHYKRVQAFVPEPFWYIEVKHAVRTVSNSKPVTVEFIWDRQQLYDEDIVTILHRRCKASNEAIITKVMKKPTSKRKPTPLTTVELQKNLSRLTGMPPKRILDLAESLYQRGFLSYPRTETDQYDKDFDFVTLLSKQRNDSAWGSLAYELHESATGASSSPDSLVYERPRNGKKNDKAHPPIHPTAHANDINGDEKKVYDYVTRRFLASCSTDAVGQETKVAMDLGGEKFHATGLVVHAENYLKIFTYEKWSDKWMPDYEEGQEFQPTQVLLKKGTTTAPSLLTEADLVNLMDKNGIGTDATIAEHIKKIIDRQYVITQKQSKTNYLVPSTLGMGLVEGYEKMEISQHLCKPILRRDTEEKLGLVALAQHSKEETVSQSMQEYKTIFEGVSRGFSTISQSIGQFLQVTPSEQSSDVNSTSSNNTAQRSTLSSTPNTRCHCGTPCSRAVDQRTGREYWACGNTQTPDEDCGFFQWCQQIPTEPSNASTGSALPNHANPIARGEKRALGIDAIMCQCDLTAKLCTTSSGPNAGRSFWTCPKESKRARYVKRGTDNRCNFFEWADENDPIPGPGTSRARTNVPGTTRRASRRGRTRTTASRAKNTPNKCYKCQGTGHWAKDCSK